MAGYCTIGLYMASFIACVMCGDTRDAQHTTHPYDGPPALSHGLSSIYRPHPVRTV